MNLVFCRGWSLAFCFLKKNKKENKCEIYLTFNEGKAPSLDFNWGKLCLHMCVLSCSVVFSSLWPQAPLLSGSSIHGVSQATILEWLSFVSPGGLPDLGMEPMNLASPALAGRFFTTSTTWIVKRKLCERIEVI